MMHLQLLNAMVTKTLYSVLWPVCQTIEPTVDDQLNVLSTPGLGVAA